MSAKQLFEERIGALCVKNNAFLIKSKDDYDQLVNEVIAAKSRNPKTTQDYRRLKRYDVLKVGDANKLIEALNSDSGVKYFVHNGEIFDLIDRAHTESGHGGVHKLEYLLKSKYSNITREALKVYLDLCDTCIKKRTHPRKNAVVKPLVFKDVNVRAQVDLIDFQTCPDGNYKFILNYQDHLSKFSCLRALKSKQAREVANHLVDIFCTFGAPCVLQSDNGREFVNSVIEELKTLWPGLKIVHGKPRHSQSQGSVERSNRDVQDMLVAWMADNKTASWSEGLKFCQFYKNNSYHQGIKQTPFEVMFGRKAKVGLASSALPASMIGALDTEEDLQDAIHSSTIVNEKSSNNYEECENNNLMYKDDIVELGDAILDESLELDINENEDFLTAITHKMKENRALAVSGLMEQATRMKVGSEKKLSLLEKETTVTIPIPSLDRGKADPRNLIGVVLDVTEDGLYKIGTQSGVLPQLYSRNQIAPCNNPRLLISDVPSTSCNLRKASTKESMFGGQGFFRCNCFKKCQDSKCMCRRKKVLCNSKCHKSSSCSNK